jgi:hypothetical protein
MSARSVEGESLRGDPSTSLRMTEGDGKKRRRRSTRNDSLLLTDYF